MSLPEAQSRKLVHSRQITFSGYQRNDGLWDIEGVLQDVKPMAFEILGERSWLPNEPIHHMSIRITVNANLIIEDIYASMNHVPHSECPNALPPMKNFIGVKLGKGWRKTIDENLGRTKGCAHLRELLFNIATASFQTITGVFDDVNSNILPPHVGGCITWRLDSELVSRTYPNFFMKKVN